jgi:hypothetical protein
MEYDSAGDSPHINNPSQNILISEKKNIVPDEKELAA